jgi:uncharacterized phage-associated protein
MAKNINIFQICKFLIAYFNSIGEELTHLKLQKLLYYIQAWHLVYKNDPLFSEEPEAWVNGPVYKNVYDFYKDKGSGPLTIELPEGKNHEEYPNELLNEIGLDEEQKELIDAVIKKYGLMPTFQLVYLTHSENPWNEAREKLSPFEPSNSKITLSSMKSYYSKLINKN